MKLYYAPGTCALSCWIALAWAGADFETQKVDPHEDSYKKINPLGVVPALAIDESDKILTQANAILQYVIDRFPNADLGANDGLLNNFEFNETMAFLTGDFHPAFWPWFAPHRFTTDESDAAKQAVQESTYARIDRVMSHLDEMIGDGVHVYQNKRTVADAYAYVMVRWSNNIPKTWESYPNVSRFMKTMQQDASVQAVLNSQDQ